MFTGLYDITIATPLGPQYARLTLVQVGATLTGQADGDIGTVGLTGTITGNTARWAMSVTKPMPVKLEVTATTAGDTLSGDVKAGFFGTFPLTGTRLD